MKKSEMQPAAAKKTAIVSKIFKTIKNASAVSKHHISLPKRELNAFEIEVVKVQATLNKHEGRDLGLGADAFDSLTLFMRTIAGDKKKKFKTYNGIMFGFGLFISKAIVTKHGGALIRDVINGDVDVLVPYGRSGAYRIFSPHRIVIELFDGGKYDVNTYLEVVDSLMALSPSEMISDLLTDSKYKL